MISNVEHLFIYPLAIFMFSLEKCLFKSFPIFKSVLFVLLLSCGSLMSHYKQSTPPQKTHMVLLDLF